MFDTLNSASVADLKKICRNERIHKYSKLKKQEIIDLIKSHRITTMVQEGIKKLNAL